MAMMKLRNLGWTAAWLLRRLAMGLDRVRSAKVPSFATGSAIHGSPSAAASTPSGGFVCLLVDRIEGDRAGWMDSDRSLPWWACVETELNGDSRTEELIGRQLRAL